MNARELNKIFEKYGIGHVRLEKPFEDSDEIHAMVVDDKGDYLESSDKWHFSSIVINDNTFGFETKDEISVDDYENFEICDLTFYSQSWAYPNAYINECGGGIDVAEKNCGIKLTDFKQYGNLDHEINLYTEQAIKMFQDPLAYQNWLLKMFLDEQTLFIEKHYPMLKEMGYWMAESGLYKRGYEHEYTSEIYIVFKTETGQSDLYIKQNLFTGKWTIDISEKKPYIVNNSENPNLYYQYNVNELSVDELRNIILKKFEKNFESFWREERKFRKEYNKVKGFNDHNSDYDINMFFDNKKKQGSK